MGSLQIMNHHQWQLDCGSQDLTSLDSTIVFYIRKFSILRYTSILKFSDSMKIKYAPQAMIRENNEKKVLEVLKESPARFNELITSTGLSRKGLQEVLTSMQQDKKISKVIHENKEAYAITSYGVTYFQERLWQVFGTMMDMKIENPLYLHSNLFFGASMDLIANDDTVQHPLFDTIPENREIALFLLGHIFYEIAEKSIKLDKASDGKLVLAVEFDLGELSEEVFSAQMLIEDLKKGEDVLEDKRLQLKESNPKDTRHRICTVLNTAKSLTTEEIQGEQKYKELRNKLKEMLNDSTHPELFSDLNPVLLSKVLNTMKKHSWESDFPTISKELETNAQDNTPEHVSEIYYYTEALEILHLGDEKFSVDYEAFLEFMDELAKKRMSFSIDNNQQSAN